MNVSELAIGDLLVVRSTGVTEFRIFVGFDRYGNPVALYFGACTPYIGTLALDSTTRLSEIYKLISKQV